MADVKWIKICTDIFENEKILLIETLPDSYAILTVWFKLLCLAGKQNNSGVFMMNNQIAYTDKMLATIFRMKETTVTMALKTFEQFGMVKMVGDVITIPNWEKYQQLDQIELAKEKTRQRVARHREKQKRIAECNVTCNVTDDVTVTVCNADRIDKDIERDKDKEKDKDKENNIYTPSEPKETKHKHGEYNNVMLTDKELDRLKAEFADYEERIEKLSSYVASTGKAYKSHYATIRNWAKNEREKNEKEKTKQEEPVIRYGGGLYV